MRAAPEAAWTAFRCFRGPLLLHRERSSSSSSCCCSFQQQALPYRWRPAPCSSSNGSSSTSSSIKGSSSSSSSSKICRKHDGVYPSLFCCSSSPSFGLPLTSFGWRSAAFVDLSVSDALQSQVRAATTSKKQQQQQQQQQQKQQQQQQQQQQQGLSEALCSALPEGVSCPPDYAGAAPSSSSSSNNNNDSSSSNNGDSSSSSSSSNDFLPAWALRSAAPAAEVLFLRVLPLAPLLVLSVGVHALPPMGLPLLARDCLSGLIAYAAALLTANAAVHVGLQLAEVGFPPQRQHRGFYNVGRLGLSLFFVVHSVLICGLVHQEPLHALYLSAASFLGLLGVDLLCTRKGCLPLW
ncbi:hypothetical protein, conserved [Eimeria acervulina]|uniref:Uncharacterized protein n=1 Tax=Eimeria acervulina TaxID=5801 RepID=U6GNM0_EIMAC|nr:hypothetical protein, conserved [Eimeria acervulina]CDI80878.1 hypothetical protein, conserved [Eimeria acervulina]